MVSAGALRERVEVLERAETGPGVFAWTPARRVWARVELDRRRAVYSRLANAAPAALLTLRVQDLTPAMALSWRGRHLAVCGVRLIQPGWLEVRAALLEPADCLFRSEGTEHVRDRLNRPAPRVLRTVRCPAVLLEKYAGYAREGAYAQTGTGAILVVPKTAGEQRVGDTAVLSGPAAGTWEIRAVHLAGAWNNEYEVIRKEEA